jgi:hypothetical protein
MDSDKDYNMLHEGAWLPHELKRQWTSIAHLIFERSTLSQAVHLLGKINSSDSWF